MKRFRWFWSYRIQSTEKWLESMALKGFMLKDFNRFTRIFTFNKTTPKKVTYSIQYKSCSLPDRLQKAGWRDPLKAGKWSILKNEASHVPFYPSSDSLFKRIRLHAYLFLIISIFYLSTSPVNFLILKSFDDNNPNFASIIIPLLILLLLASVTIFVFISYRAYEKYMFNLNEEVKNSRKRIRKIRLAWMYQPLQTKKWLDEMHRKGYELDRVYAAIFTFVPSKHEKIAYEVTFEPKLKSDYYTLHKEIGWKLKYTSNMSVLNYSIWSMPYSEQAPKPSFTYDIAEKRQQIKKAFKMNITITLFLLLVLGQSLYMQWVLDMPSSTFTIVLKYLITFMTFFWIILTTKAIIGYKKEMNLLKEF
ncbi:DUF2812 domain-containing protein [Psychrobacillus sp. MER TA 171]|uniref:DUF2812 domain-containing protein n=1 Tax=Psychrobacillus sp. MER TA 171 TaxID=2939577 RepID=UPI00203AB11F|nr:DUF2812 domain-containing protein [Psychrobacillus sp. MER TA 171]MCM3357288.1 DUF2812 domain-containing protein [Psychrobacillus sp. MER TA 171]